MNHRRVCCVTLVVACIPLSVGAAAIGELRLVDVVLHEAGDENGWSAAGVDERGRADRSPLKAETILLSESFEGSWPAAPWRVTHPADAADVDWGRTDYRASDGSHSIWCAGSGTQSPGQGGQVPGSTSSWAIAGPFDLTEAAAGTLTFDLWLSTEQFHDIFMWLVSTDGVSFSGEGRPTDTHGWKAFSVHLADRSGAGDVTGQSHVWIALVYQSDHSNMLEGAYVDNVTLVSDSGSQGGEGFTYTTTEDFALGTLVGLEHGTDAVQLSADGGTLPYIWVPNSGTGTVSKVDTETGGELGRYRTGPERDLDPSPATVDLEGACWVGNRGAGTVVKIGLVENGGCVDRDGNGVIDTSADTDEDGDITGEELLDWGVDECVLYEVLLVAGQEGTYIPGDDHGEYARNHLRALAVDAEGNVWVGVYDSGSFYRVDGASGEILETLELTTDEVLPSAVAVDSNGMLWSASWPDPWVLRVDPASGEPVVVGLAHGSWALALDRDEHLFVTGFADSALSRVDVSADEVDWAMPADWQSSGAAVTGDGDIWVAAAGSGTVTRFSSLGQNRGSIPLDNGPTGVAVDTAGKVWVVGSTSDMIVRIDPATNQVDLQKILVASGGHEAASDMTGLVARTVTTRFGTWTVVYDSLVEDTAWGTITWSGSEPEGSVLAVRVRSSSDQVTWSSWEQAATGTVLAATPVGRYLQTEAALQLASGEESPVLEELTVMPSEAVQTPEAGFTWAPAEPAVGQAVQFTDTSEGEPTSWSWDFGDGGSSSEQSPPHVFAAAGVYSVTLQVGNEGGSDSVTHEVTAADQGPETCTSVYWVPVVIHAGGASGSQWRTDLGLLGVGGVTAAVELRFYGFESVIARATSVGPQAMVDLVDVVDWISPGAQASGALEVCADGALIVTSRTYNQLGSDDPCQPSGSFGQGLDGAESVAGLSAGKAAYLSHLRENAAFRTNIGLVNTGIEAATVEISLFGASGASVEAYSVVLEPGQWWQDNRPFFNRAGRDDLDAAWAGVAVSAGSGVFAYASVIDNVTNDPTTVTMARSTSGR